MRVPVVHRNRRGGRHVINGDGWPSLGLAVIERAVSDLSLYRDRYQHAKSANQRTHVGVALHDLVEWFEGLDDNPGSLWWWCVVAHVDYDWVRRVYHGGVL